MAKKKKAKKNAGIKVTNLKITNSGRALTAYWKGINASKYKKLSHYLVTWKYKSNAWNTGATNKVTGRVEDSYTLPNNATQGLVIVKPVQIPKKELTAYNKKQKSAKKKVKQWTGGTQQAVSAYIGTAQATPDTPSVPTVEIVGNQMTMYIENYAGPTGDDTTITFYVIKEWYTGETRNVQQVSTPKATVKYGKATVKTTIDSGASYTVRCRATKNGINSGFSQYSQPQSSLPGEISSLTCTAIDATDDDKSLRVSLTWAAASNVTVDDSYEIQYTQKEEYFDRSAKDVTSETIEEGKTTAYITISGQGEYYFRVRGVNQTGRGGWSPNAVVTVGLPPDKPTTWSYTSAVSIGEDAILNWTHNSADGSKQKAAKIEITVIPEESQGTDPVPYEEPIDGDTMRFFLKTDEFLDGTKIKWRVCTKGIYAKYSDWSVQRTITVYQKPSVDIVLDLEPIEELTIETEASEQMTAYPLDVTLIANPQSQKPISVDFYISTNEAYTIEDDTGLDEFIAAGQIIFTKHIDNPNSNTITFELGPGDVSLEKDIDYTVSVTVAMDSGISATNTYVFLANFKDDYYIPDAAVEINEEDYTARIRPYCMDDFGGEYRSGFKLRVYRRNYDGTYTLIQNGNSPDIDPGDSQDVTDPHPTLDYARYRIVSRSNTTGQLSYYDVPGVEVKATCIVFNWDESWTYFDGAAADAEEPDAPSWPGMQLILPYNVDVTEQNNQDTALVEYIGRENPVSYYGTQKGYTGSWKCDIPKSDVESLYLVRQLARYAGDVYVREPSGIGYWANVKVSYNYNHNTTVVPVTFNITRVEGGM